MVLHIPSCQISHTKTVNCVTAPLGVSVFNAGRFVRLAIVDALRAHHSLRWAIFNTTSFRRPRLVPQIAYVTDAMSCILLDYSSRPVIVVLVRRVIRPVEDRRAPIVGGERNSVLDTCNQVLNLMSQNMIAWHLRNSQTRTGL